MGETVTGECRECGDDVAIDSTSLNFLTSATTLEREEAMLCDYHLQEELEGRVIDLSIGSDHTRSEEFEAEREKRKQERKEGQTEYAKQTKSVVFEDIYEMEDPDLGTIEVCEIDLPKEAKADIKALDYDRVRYGWDDERRCWRCRVDAGRDVVRHLEDEGWTVTVRPFVASRL